MGTDKTKTEARKKYAGVFTGTRLDSNRFWEIVTKKSSRKIKFGKKFDFGNGKY